MPVAVNCSEVPAVIDAFGAVMAIELSLIGIITTVSGKTFEFTPLNDALMLVEPAAIAAERPVVPIVATPVFEELQVTWLLMFAVELSL